MNVRKQTGLNVLPYIKQSRSRAEPFHIARLGLWSVWGGVILDRAAYTMYPLMNTFVHCFLSHLPFPIQDILWPGQRSDLRFGCLCGRKKSLLDCSDRADQAASVQYSGHSSHLGPVAFLWGISTWFWVIWQFFDLHLCSPFLLQRSLGFPKPFNHLDVIMQSDTKGTEDHCSIAEMGFGFSTEVDSTFGFSEVKEEFEPPPPLEDGHFDGGLGTVMPGQGSDKFFVDEFEFRPEILLDSTEYSGLDIDQTFEEDLLTVFDTGGGSSFAVGECQTDEDMNSLLGYLDESVVSPMNFGRPIDSDVWLPLEPGGEIFSAPVRWSKLHPGRGPLKVDLGFETFSGMECYGIGNHLGRIIINTGPDNGDPESGVTEGGSGSDEDYSRHEKAGGAATSGGENDGDELDQDWKSPDPELIQKLVVQIEYYLSDENLEKDAFLLKHVRRNKMGFVSVKLLTSFKKVKHLTRDWRTTAYALRYSDILELNEDNRKVRRKSPVPVFASENLPSKMLLVYDLHFIPELQCLNKEQENGGMQEKIMEQLLKSFGAFGSISSIRILKPGRDLPSDVKRFSSRYTQVGTKNCAIVEFEEVEAAIKAHETLNVESDTDDGIKVVLIGMKPPKKKIQKDRSKEEDSKNLRKNKSLNKRVEELQYIGDESTGYSTSEPDSNPNSPMVGRKIPSTNKLSPSAYPNNHLSPNASPRNSPWSSPCGQRKGVKHSPLAESMSPEVSRRSTEYSSDSSITPSSSPWVQRRRQAQTVTQEKSPACSPMLGRKIQNADGLPPGVLRLPRGPDGTKGFHNGTERNKLVQNL